MIKVKIIIIKKNNDKKTNDKHKKNNDDKTKTKTKFKTQFLCKTKKNLNNS